MHNNEKKVQVGKEISVHFNYIKRYFLLKISDKKYLAEMNKIFKNKKNDLLIDDALFEWRSRTF